MDLIGGRLYALPAQLDETWRGVLQMDGCVCVCPRRELLYWNVEGWRIQQCSSFSRRHSLSELKAARSLIAF